MQPIKCKVLVLGGGPGGYVCATRAGQLGLDTVLIERNRLGGTCLNVGCIPSKALIHAADEFDRARHFESGSAIGIDVSSPRIDLAKTMAWKDSIVARLNAGVAALLRRAKVKVVIGAAVIKDGKTCQVETDTGNLLITAEHLVIATGSEPLKLPSLAFSDMVISSTEALSLPAIPHHLAIVGGGYIGLELGMAYRKLGAQVTVIEAAERLLPQYAAELTGPVAARATELGIRVLLGAKVLGLTSSGTELRIMQATGAEIDLAADKVLLTVGRQPHTRGFGLEGLDLATNGCAIRIDDQCRTSMRNVWAIGDVTGEPMLAHRAMAQGEMVAEIIAGKRRAFDRIVIPAICFTDPEIVTVGLSPDTASATAYDLKTGTFPFTSNGRALTMEGATGFVRIVARADNHVILGIQAVGRGVSELSAAFGLVIEMGGRLEDVAATIHAHPTQGEALREASTKALGHALHA